MTKINKDIFSVVFTEQQQRSSTAGLKLQLPFGYWPQRCKKGFETAHFFPFAACLLSSLLKKKKVPWTLRPPEEEVIISHNSLMTAMRTHVAESTIKLSAGVKGSRTILVNVSIKKKTILGFTHKRSQTIAPTYPVYFYYFSLFDKAPLQEKSQRSCSVDKQTYYVNVPRRNVHKCTRWKVFWQLYPCRRLWFLARCVAWR